MAAIWRGTVSFGLVSIPVKLHSATEERGVSFRQVHGDDGGRIRYKRVCSIDGEEVPYGDIAKGYELPDGDMVVLTDEDLASLPLATQRTIEVLQFVPAEQIDGLYFSRGYYLAAEGPGVKPYVLLRDALDRAGRVALVKVALRNRESLAVLRSREGALVVQTMLWPDEIRDPAVYAPDDDVAVRDQEVAMAESYIATLSEDFNPSAYTDDYRAALEELVQAKAAGRELREPAQPADTGGAVVDLMAALRASVDAARARRAGGEPAAETASDGQAEQPAAPRRRTTGRKAAAPARAAAAEAAEEPQEDAAPKRPAGKRTTGRRAAEPAAEAASGPDSGAGSGPESEAAGRSGRRKAPAKRSTTSSAKTTAKDAEKKAPARKSA